VKRDYWATWNGIEAEAGEDAVDEATKRVKAIDRLPGDRSYLSLVWAVLGRASRGWRGVEMTPKIVR